MRGIWYCEAAQRWDTCVGEQPCIYINTMNAPSECLRGLHIPAMTGGSEGAFLEPEKNTTKPREQEYQPRTRSKLEARRGLNSPNTSSFGCPDVRAPVTKRARVGATAQSA